MAAYLTLAKRIMQDDLTDDELLECLEDLTFWCYRIRF